MRWLRELLAWRPAWWRAFWALVARKPAADVDSDFLASDGFDPELPADQAAPGEQTHRDAMKNFPPPSYWDNLKSSDDTAAYMANLRKGKK